jgi:hypothetical protein
MNNQLLVAMLVALITGPGGWGTLQFILSRKQKERDRLRDDQAKKADDRRSSQAEESQTWYRESRHHYELAVKETSQAKKECAECRDELRASKYDNHHTRLVVFTLLETLEDQIIPALGLPNADVNETRKAMRVAIHSAREALR